MNLTYEQFTEQSEALRSRLENTAMRIMKNRDDAEEAVNQSLFKAHRAFPNYRGDAKLTTWLHRITVNECLMRLRRARDPRVQFVSMDDQVENHDPVMGMRGGRPQPEICSGEKSVLDGMVDGENVRRVAHAVSHLPAALRTVVQLRAVDGLGLKEIGETLGISEPAVKSRMLRARKRLAKMLSNPAFGTLSGHSNGKSDSVMQALSGIADVETGPSVPHRKYAADIVTVEPSDLPYQGISFYDASSRSSASVSRKVKKRTPRQGETEKAEEPVVKIARARAAKSPSIKKTEKPAADVVAPSGIKILSPNMALSPNNYAIIQEGFSQLSAQKRELIWMHAEQHYTKKRIAAEFGLSTRLVKRRLQKAYDALGVKVNDLLAQENVQMVMQTRRPRRPATHKNPEEAPGLSAGASLAIAAAPLP